MESVRAFLRPFQEPVLAWTTSYGQSDSLVILMILAALLGLQALLLKRPGVLWFVAAIMVGFYFGMSDSVLRTPLHCTKGWQILWDWDARLGYSSPDRDQLDTWTIARKVGFIVLTYMILRGVARSRPFTWMWTAPPPSHSMPPVNWRKAAQSPVLWLGVLAFVAIDLFVFKVLTALPGAQPVCLFIEPSWGHSHR